MKPIAVNHKKEEEVELFINRLRSEEDLYWEAKKGCWASSYVAGRRMLGIH